MRYSCLFGAKISSVGYCHIDDGCKSAITGTHGSNGIAAAPNGTVYVADSLYGGVLFLEPQADNTLVVSESVKTGTRYITQCTYYRSSVSAFVQIMHSTI
jgi:arylesterase/paraoxonase